MRIRKRCQNPLPPPDLSSALRPSIAAAAPRGVTSGGKEGEATAAAAAVRVPGGGCGGSGASKELHPDGHTTSPTTCPPFSPPPSAAAARRAESGDVPIPGPCLLFDYGHNKEVPKREQDGENKGKIGDAHGRWNMDALRCDSGDATIPKSLGSEASEVSAGGHGGRKRLPSDAAAEPAAAEAMVRWGGDEEAELFPLKKRRGSGYHAGRRSFGLEAEAGGAEGENVVVEREMKQRRPSNTRRRRAAAPSSATMAAAGTVLASAGAAGNGGAATAGDGAGGATKGDDVGVKEERGDLVDGNRCGGNGKKRRSPAVLMEGSRCSRVNGRGWRCCQQTLVGYSLCEHHLGKGRLRSVSSVRCNGRARKKEDVAYHHGAAAPPLPSPLRQQDQLLLGDGDEEEEGKPSGKRRRNKIGMVKARSISSLLHQPDHPTPTVIAAPEEPISPSPSPNPSPRPVATAAPPSYASDTTAAA